MSRTRSVLKAVTPPVVLDGVRRVRDRMSATPLPSWEVEPRGWAARDTTRGWDVEGVATAALARLPAFRAALEGPAVLGMGTEADTPVNEASEFAEREALVFAHAVLRASLAGREVSVLDWGGGIGCSGLIARAVLPDDVALDYHCREQPTLCAAARDAVPEVHFWDDDACFDRTYDLVVASSSLQYAEDWVEVLDRLARAARRLVLVTRVPVVQEHPAFVVRQRVPEYDTEYLGWVFNRDELLRAAAASGLRLEREFVLGFRPAVVGAPEQDETRAYLLASGLSASG